MADRYLVGTGTRTWDATSTTPWSATSGGASGASAPTSSDNVIVDANSGTGTLVVASGAAWATLTVTWTAAKTNIIQFGADFPAGGTISINGNSAINRILVQSTVAGTPRTITATIGSLSNVDFADIVGAGAGPWSGTSIGDALGNSGITMTPSVTQTATGTASFTWSTHGWTTRVPLPQDDVVVPNAFIAGRVISIDMPRLGRNVTFTCTGNPTFAPSLATAVYGSVSMAPGMVDSGTATMTMASRSASTMLSAGYAWTRAIGVNGPGGSITLQDALSTTSSVSIFNGNLITAGFTVTVGGRVDISGAGATLTPGASLINVTGVLSGLVWNNVFGNFVAGTSTIRISSSAAGSKSFVGSGATYNIVEFTGAGVLSITGSNTFNTLRAQVPGTVLQFAAGATQTITNPTVNGTTATGSDVKVAKMFGVAGGGFTTPDSAASSVTGDLDIRVKVAPADWSPAVLFDLVAKWEAAPELGYVFRVNTAGTLLLSWSANGTATISATSTANLSALADGALKWVRATLDVDNGAVGNDVKFYTSDDYDPATEAGTWTQLGATVTTAGTTSVHNSASLVRVGGRDSSNGYGTIDVHRALVYNGIAGTRAVDFNPNDYTGAGGATWVSSGANGETWTKAGNVIVSATNQVAICSATAASHTLTKAGGGKVQCTNVSVDRSTATPGTTFHAITSTNGGNNSGWVFGAYIDAEACSFAANPRDANLLYHRRLDAEASSFAISGQAATLTFTQKRLGRIRSGNPKPAERKRPRQS
jgi:hypothetical protein